MSKPQLLAFYLPQYHPTPHNDEWWGKGFTEWTNVAKAKKLYKGHYQPHIPADLGFYDLRVPEVRERQAEMARYANVSAFCYYHYWFENGVEELDMPFKEVVASQKPDFPFCLCWANESWYSKMWNREGAVVGKKLLAEQKYLGDEDNREHFESLLNAFQDRRYYRYDNKLVFVIYKPLLFKDVERFIEQWRQMARENGLNDFYFIGYSYDVEEEYCKIKQLGFDAVISCGIINHMRKRDLVTNLAKKIKTLYRKCFNLPDVYQYKSVYPYFVNDEYDTKEDVIPSLIPNWDHTPRSGSNGYLFANSTPEYFSQHVKDVKAILDKKQNPLCILKSWNEWGEGNYVEPDLKYGWGFLDALKNHLK